MEDAANGLILVNEDYTTNKLNKPVRVPEALYNDFRNALPLNTDYSPMMVNLMMYYLHGNNRETINTFITKLSAHTPTADT